jgi:flagellar biosynthetic protein FliR
MEIFLSSLFEQTDIYLLIIVRLLGFFVIMPIFGGTNVPTMTRIGLSVVIAGIIISTQQVQPIIYYDNVFMYAFLVLKEVVVGIMLGFCVYIVIATLYLAGQLVDFQIGFSMVSVFDPLTQIQVPITGNLYYFLVSVILVVTNAHYTIFRALFYSYKVLPIGAANILSNEVMSTFMAMISSYFIISVKIALPIMGAILVLDSALGLMARTAPQINIFSVGVPLKLLIGLIIIWATADMFKPVSDYLFQLIYENLFNIIKGLIP